MRKLLRINFLIVILLSLFACRHNGHKAVKSDKEMQELKEPLVKVNKMLVEKDDLLIRKYFERRGIDAEHTQTGLWYHVFERGSDQKIHSEELVRMKYTLELLDGSYCYSSDSSGVKQFVCSRGEVETGLDEVVTLLNQNDSAIVVIPPHLGFGLHGDENKIPPRSIIVYHLRLL